MSELKYFPHLLLYTRNIVMLSQQFNSNFRKLWLADKDLNENGLIYVTIRGSDEDVQNAKKTIEGMTADLLIVATPQEPVVQKEYEMIDWKAAALQCVSFSSFFPIFLQIFKSNLI